MNRLWVTTAAFAAAALAACAGEDGKAGRTGAAGENCSVSVTGGAPVLTCPDGTSTPLDPGSCSVADNGDGSHTITCPGGEPTVIRDGEQLPRSTIAGTATRFGLPASDDVEVTLVELDRTVGTDDDGRFVFADIAPGTYRLRLSAPGYQPLDIPNVSVLGSPVDIGLRTIKLGRQIATGLTDAVVTPDGSTAALVEQGLIGDVGALALVDIATGERTELFDGVDYVEFLDDRFLAVAVSNFDGDDELVIFDRQTGTSKIYVEADEWTLLADGFIYRADGVAFFVQLPSLDETEIGEGYVSWDGDDYAILTMDAGGFAYVIGDPANVVKFPGLTWDWRAHEGTGRLAFFETAGSAYELKVMDTSMNAPRTIAAALNGMLAWSDDGELLFFRTLDGHAVTNMAGVISPITIPSGITSVYFNATGRFLLGDGGGNSMAIDRITGNTWTLPQTWWDVSPNERWLVSLSAGRLRVADLHGEAGNFAEYMVSGWDFVTLAGDRVLVTDEDRLHIIDPADGSTVVEAASLDSGWTMNETRDRVYFADRDTNLVSVIDVASGSIHALDVLGQPNGFTPDGRWLVVLRETERNGFSQMAFDFVSADGNTVIPVDEKVFDAREFEGGLVYWAGDIDDSMIPRVYDMVDPFAGVGVYWVAYP